MKVSDPASLRATTAYAVVLVAVFLVLGALGPHAREVVIARMSTNLHNLAHGRVDTLIGSAFVTESEIPLWLPGLLCLLALGELIWRGRGLLLAFAAGHIGATLIVAVGLVVAIKAGWLPTSIAYATDVGISYGAVGVLGALTGSIPSPWRLPWIGWWLGATGAAATGGDFAAFGHIAALLLGMASSAHLPSATHWTAPRLLLLAVGSAFGFSAVAGSAVIPLAGASVGALWGLLAGQRRGQRHSRRTDRTPPGA